MRFAHFRRLDDLWRDAVHASRLARREPRATIAIVISLALGVGATTAMLSVVNAALLRPLPYRDAGRLVQLWETRGTSNERSRISWPDLADWRLQRNAFAAMEAFDQTNIAVVGAGDATMMRGARVTSGFFSMLGVRPHIGRILSAPDAEPAAGPGVMLDHGFWVAHYAGDPSAVGRALTINGVSHTIVGVLPPGFRFAPAGDAALWLPIATPTGDGASNRSNRGLNPVARLAPGVSPLRAQAMLGALVRAIAERDPDPGRSRGAVIVPLRESVAGNVRPVLVALLGAVALVLLVACANVATIQVTRAAARGRELAVRAALGASRGRLVQQALTESVLLAAIGGALGIGLARLLVASLVAAIPPGVLDGMPYLHDVAVDRAVLAYTMAVVLGAGIAFGAAPALIAARMSRAQGLVGATRVTASGPAARVRDALVAVEVALTLVLLVGVGLMGRSLLALANVSPGFEPAGVFTFRVGLSGDRYASPESQQRVFDQLLARLRVLPGVQGVGAVSSLPLGGGRASALRVEGVAGGDADGRPTALVRGVAGDYFATMRIRLVAGRTFASSDDANAVPALVINASLARRLFPARSPLGERVRIDAIPGTAWTIVGVVGDVKTGPLDAPVPPTVYYSHLQVAENRMSIVARVAGDAASLAGPVRGIVREIDATIPVYGVQSLQQEVADSQAVFARRYPLAILAALATTAIVLTLVGIHGVVSSVVAQRTRELAIRMALGARAANILRVILWRGLAITLVGLVAGAAIARLSAGALRSALYDVTPSDATTYAVVSVTLAAISAAAAALAARRVTRIDPAETLRRD
jgi:putative ABC transport system permease protein